MACAAFRTTGERTGEIFLIFFCGDAIVFVFLCFFLLSLKCGSTVLVENSPLFYFLFLSAAAGLLLCSRVVTKQCGACVRACVFV